MTDPVEHQPAIEEAEAQPSTAHVELGAAVSGTSPDVGAESTTGVGGRQTRVAALFVQTNGAYFGLNGIDPWDVDRDARRYNGPYPVVAHPPCQLWVNLAAVNFKRYGGAHNRPGNDGGCFASALASVRKFGGVLEHPAGSNAWRAFGLLEPLKCPGWRTANHREWTCEVWQSAYGHKARKRTWLYYCGLEPPQLNWARDPGTHQIGWFDRIKPTLSKKEAIATPPAFREELLRLARRSAARKVA